MDLKHLRYFVAVAEELHFGRAAQRVGIAQPPLSQMILRLEEELGVELLHRTHRRVELTAAGQAMLPEARAALAQAERAAAVARSAGRGEIGSLTVGFVSSAAYGVLPSVIREFRVQRPGVELVLREMTSDEQLQALHSETLDLGLVRRAEPVKGMKQIVISREPLMAVLPSGHRLARNRSPLALRELKNEPFLMISAKHAPVFDRVVRDACRRAGFAPNVVQEANASETIVHLAAGGVGVSLLPMSLKNLRRPGVVYRSLSGKPPVVELSLIWREQPANAALAHFLELVKQQASGFDHRTEHRQHSKESSSDR